MGEPALETQSESVNENTVDSVEPIVRHGGESLTNFDELETVIEGGKVTKEPQKVEETEEVKEDKVKEDDVDEATNADPEEVDDEKSEDEASDEPEIAAKIYKLKQGEGEIDLSADTVVPIKIDGKTEEVKVQDLMDNFSGQASLTRKFTEFKRQQEEFVEDKSTIQNVLNEFHRKAVEDSDPTSAIDYLGDLMGVDMKAYWDTVIGQLKEQAETLSEMTDEEKSAWEVSRQNEYLQKQLDHERSRSSERQVQATLENRVQEVQSQYGVEPKQFNDLYFEILDSGLVEQDQITPEFVGQYADTLKNHDELSSLVSEVNPTLEDPNEAIDELQKIRRLYPELGPSELKQYAMEVYGSKEAQILSKKLQRSKPTNTAKPKNRDPQDMFNFEQLDSLL